MTQAYKYRIYPNKQQQNNMMQTFGCVRVVYNTCIDTYTSNYETWKGNGKQGKLDDKVPQISEMKQDKPWLANADSLAISVTRQVFSDALRNFFASRNGKRKGKKIGFPKYKKRGKARFSYTTCNQYGNIRFDDGDKHIKLPKLGWVKCIKHIPLPEGGTIKRVCVSMTKAGEFYVSLNVECEERAPLINKARNADNLRVVGLDMSLQHFCVSSDKSDDTITKYVRIYRKEERKLSLLNRRLSRTKSKVKKEINGEIKEVEAPHHRRARLKLAKTYGRISRRRNEFCIKMARYFSMKYDVVCIEDLNMQNMSRTLHLGKSVMDLGWGTFVRWLEHEASKYDTVVYRVDKWYPSSKTCNHCGYKNSDLSLSDRSWVCPECGSVLDRDRNAAENLRDYFLSRYNTAGTAEINACGELTYTLREILGRVISRPPETEKKQETEHNNVHHDADEDDGSNEALGFSRG